MINSGTRTVWPAPVLLLGFVFGCQGASAKHEALGDESYARGRFEEALSEYRLAAGENPSAVLRNKTALAALNAGALTDAATEFTTLGQAFEDRATYAADGLERVAQAASRDENREALRTALTGLQTLSEGRAIGNFARELARDFGNTPDSPDALDVLAYAAAAAPDVDQQDSLMFAYSAVLRRLGRCAAAVPVLESLIRRGRVPEMVSQARTWAAGCALTIGRQELGTLDHGVAVDWFRKAIFLDPGTRLSRAARIGIGDALAAMGDFTASLDAYEQARSGLQQSDSLYQVVGQKINGVFDARRMFR